MSKNRDSIADRLGRPEDAGALPASSLPPGMTLEQALAVLAQSQVQTNAALQVIAGDREHYLSEERREIEAQKRIRAECEKTTQQRTQEAADRKWPRGQGRYRVALLDQQRIPDPANPARQVKALVPDRAFPEVDIWADSADEARERYRVIQGIRSTDKEIRAIATGDLKPQAAPPRWDEPAEAHEEAARRELEKAGCVPA